MEAILEMLKKYDKTPDAYFLIQTKRCYLQYGDLECGLKTFEDYMNSTKPPTIEFYVTLVRGAMVGYTHKGMQFPHDTLVNISLRNFFLSPKIGNNLLTIAAGERTGGYTTANYIWDLVQAKNIIPSLPPMEAYYNGLKEREIPKNDPRLMHVTQTYDNLCRRFGTGGGQGPGQIVALVEKSKGWSSVEASSDIGENVMIGVYEEELYNIRTAEFVHKQYMSIDREFGRLIENMNFGLGVFKLNIAFDRALIETIYVDENTPNNQHRHKKKKNALNV